MYRSLHIFNIDFGLDEIVKSYKWNFLGSETWN